MIMHREPIGSRTCANDVVAQLICGSARRVWNRDRQKEIESESGKDVWSKNLWKKLLGTCHGPADLNDLTCSQELLRGLLVFHCIFGKNENCALASENLPCPMETLGARLLDSGSYTFLLKSLQNGGGRGRQKSNHRYEVWHRGCGFKKGCF